MRMLSAVRYTGLCETTVNNVDHVDSIDPSLLNWIHVVDRLDYFLFTEIMLIANLLLYSPVMPTY